MNLVITYYISDGCSYGYTITQPLEYESEEAFAVEFEEACKQGKLEWEHSRPRPSTFDFAGLEWVWDDFFERDSNKKHVYTAPEIHTLEEWFENNKGIRQ